MSDWFFHRGIPVMGEKPAFKAPRGNRSIERLAIYAPRPADAASGAQRKKRAISAGEWLPHCDRRLKQLARRTRAAAPEISDSSRRP